MRPLSRQVVLDLLLSLTTHYTKPTRNAAIVTVKRWVPDQPELGDNVLAFARTLLKRIEEAKLTKSEEETDMEVDGEEKKPEIETFAQVQNGEIVEGLPDIKTETHLQQHLELLLALSAKIPNLLDE